MQDELIKLGISLLIGSLLGLEREYHNKPAGFRTIALICVGSAIFTMLSMHLGSGSSPDRIASNILTGIGFIGAGVIFKPGNNVLGLTTAATIWIAAALGMATGAGNYLLAGVSLGVVLLILTVFEQIQKRVQLFHQRRIYSIYTGVIEEMLAVEKEMKHRRLSFDRLKEKRSSDGLMFQYEVTGRMPKLQAFDAYLLHNERVKAYEF